MQTSGNTLKQPAPPLHELLEAGLATNPEAMALVSPSESVTWRELELQASSLAAGYRRMGLKPGDRIASLMPNRIGLVVHYLACLRSGLCLTPLNYRYTAREIDHALGVSDASVLLFHTERVEDLKESQLVSKLPLGTISYGGEKSEQRIQFESLLKSDPPLEVSGLGIWSQCES
jgi:acyl-CoA synthetase (AMP-forming)/AMP-acid ligase II